MTMNNGTKHVYDGLNLTASYLKRHKYRNYLRKENISDHVSESILCGAVELDTE